MFKISSAIMGLTLAGSSYAVELSQATNKQIIEELASRLEAGAGVSSFQMKVYCRSKVLWVEMYKADLTGQLDNFTTFFDSEDLCERARSSIPFRGGQLISAGTQFAVCDGRALEVHGVSLEGKLDRVSIRGFDTPTICADHADAFNKP